MTPAGTSGAVPGWPKALLRFEGAALMATALLAYYRLDHGTAFGDSHLGRIGSLRA